MEHYANAFSVVMKTEGAYANNPADTGGETYAGISRKWNPTWGGWRAVDAAKKQTGEVRKINQILANDAVLQADIQKFYKLNYWDTLRLDQIDSPALSEKLFDISVNMGVKKAGLILQEALNLTNGNGRIYPDIAMDGQVGPKTLTLANSHPRLALLILVVKALQGERYLNIMRADGSQEVFANTWFNRI